MKRLCLEPTCPNVQVYRGRCQRHARERDKQINRAGRKVYQSKRWNRTRERHLLEQPLCEAEGCGEIATTVHHKRDLADGGDPWSSENLEALCTSCHSKITRRRQAA